MKMMGLGGETMERWSLGVEEESAPDDEGGSECAGFSGDNSGDEYGETTAEGAVGGARLERIHC